MKTSKSTAKALMAAVLLGVGGMAVAVAHQGPGKPGTRIPGKIASAPAGARIKGNASFALIPGQQGRVGGIKIIYRGLVKPGKLQMAVVIPDLDPLYAYAHTIDTASAKRGFSLAGQKFRLISAKRARIWLKWTGPSVG